MRMDELNRKVFGWLVGRVSNDPAPVRGEIAAIMNVSQTHIVGHIQKGL